MVLVLLLVAVLWLAAGVLVACLCRAAALGDNVRVVSSSDNLAATATA